MREVDINQTLADVLHIVEPEAARRGIAIDYDRSQQQLSVRADHVHLQQVLLNLALNGMDAMDGTRDRRMVFQTSQVTDREVQVAVLDSGVGIPEHKLNDIFELFVTTKQQGTGLGLSSRAPSSRCMAAGSGPRIGRRAGLHFASSCRWRKPRPERDGAAGEITAFRKICRFANA